MNSFVRVVFVFTCLVTASAAFAIIPPNTCPFVAPVVDGTFAPFEWDTADTVDLPVNLPEGGSVPGRIYVMNDADFLYVALQIKRGTPDLASSFAITLDANRDARVTGGDDLFLISHSDSDGDLAFDDVLYVGDKCPTGGICTAFDTDRGGTNDVTAASGFDGTYVTYELAKPLMTGDLNDAAMPARSSLGMKFVIRLLGPNVYADTHYPTYPNGRFGIEYPVSDCGPAPF